MIAKNNGSVAIPMRNTTPIRRPIRKNEYSDNNGIAESMLSGAPEVAI